MPATISAVLSSAMPVAAALRPVNAFSSEMTTGMSAPPIGSTTKLPSSAAATQHADDQELVVLEPAAMATRAGRRRPRAAARLTNCCAGPSLIGRPGRISCSLPNAMFEPQKEIEPMIAANSEGSPRRSALSVAAGVAELGPRDQRHRAAADAVEQRHHLRHRGHLHLARRGDADGGADRRRRGRSGPSCRIPAISSVATTAIAMPTAAMRLPRTAVRGPVSPLRP